MKKTSFSDLQVLAGDDQAHLENREAAEDGELARSPQLGPDQLDVGLGDRPVFADPRHQNENKLEESKTKALNCFISDTFP